MRRILPVILLVLLSSSCGIVRFGSSELFTAGPAIRSDYAPQGIVEERICPCSVPGPTQRRLIAYLPADYYTSGKNYPVIYLLHGARGYETSWVRYGEVYHTADSLWALGKAVPCIIIMPNVNQYNDDRDYGDSRFKNAFESIFEVDGIVESAFMDDVVGYVDSVYRTIPDKEHRAIAGLSIGAYQAIYFGTNYPDAFDYFGIMSPYMWSLGHPSITRHRFFSQMRRRMKVQFQDPPKGYYLYAGTWDMARPSTERLDRFMTRKGYPHAYTIFPGSHDWPTGWKEEFKDFLQHAFQEP